jgi:hypothetical protein
MRPSSVVQTGVKSAGWEKRIVHELSMKLWKSMSPWVVLAWKLGAIEPSRRRGCSWAGVAYDRRRKAEDWKLEMRERGRWVRVKGANDRMKLRDAEAILKVEQGYGRREENDEKETRRNPEGKSIVIFADNFFVQRWHHFTSAYLPRGMLVRNIHQYRGMHRKKERAAVMKFFISSHDWRWRNSNMLSFAIWGS